MQRWKTLSALRSSPTKSPASHRASFRRRESSSEYFDPNTISASRFAMDNQFPQAVEHFRVAVALRPQDADAEANSRRRARRKYQTPEADRAPSARACS